MQIRIKPSTIRSRSTYEEYELKMKHFVLLEETIEALCIQIPRAEKMLAIKGVSMAVIAEYFAKVGDIRRFDLPKQI